MSETINLACLDCRVSLWIGQRSAGEPLPYLYATPEHIAALNLFLSTHRGHLLCCLRDNDAFTRVIDGHAARISLEELAPPSMVSPRQAASQIYGQK